MVFMPGVFPKLETEGLAHWFVFHRGAMLVRLGEGKATIPTFAGRQAPGPDMTRAIYFGQLDGTPCYATIGNKPAGIFNDLPGYYL